MAVHGGYTDFAFRVQFWYNRGQLTSLFKTQYCGCPLIQRNYAEESYHF